MVIVTVLVPPDVYVWLPVTPTMQPWPEFVPGGLPAHAGMTTSPVEVSAGVPSPQLMLMLYSLPPWNGSTFRASSFPSWKVPICPLNWVPAVAANEVPPADVTRV